MINIETLQEIHRLSVLYENRWGKEVDYIGMPSNCSQEMLLMSLRVVVNTGESVLIGMKKVRTIALPFIEYLAKYHGEHSISNGFAFEKPCPFCGNKVFYYSNGTSWEYRCDTKNCFKETFRGI